MDRASPKSRGMWPRAGAKVVPATSAAALSASSSSSIDSAGGAPAPPPRASQRGHASSDSSRGRRVSESTLKGPTYAVVQPSSERKGSRDQQRQLQQQQQHQQEQQQQQQEQKQLPSPSPRRSGGAAIPAHQVAPPSLPSHNSWTFATESSSDVGPTFNSTQRSEHLYESLHLYEVPSPANQNRISREPTYEDIEEGENGGGSNQRDNSNSNSNNHPAPPVFTLPGAPSVASTDGNNNSSVANVQSLRSKRRHASLESVLENTELPVPASHGSLLRSLDTSVGTLHPAFSPYRRLYVLIVPPETQFVQFYATAYQGSVHVDKGPAHVPVKLLPQGFTHKVVIECSPEPVLRHTSSSASAATGAAGVEEDGDFIRTSRRGTTLSRGEEGGEDGRGGAVASSQHHVRQHPLHSTSAAAPATSAALFAYVVDIRRSDEVASAMTREPPKIPIFQDAAFGAYAKTDFFRETPSIYVAKYAFEAVGPRELSLRAGDKVMVVMKSDSGWWAGYKLDSSTFTPEGWFPASYLEYVGSSAHLDADLQPPQTLQRQAVHSTILELAEDKSLGSGQVLMSGAHEEEKEKEREGDGERSHKNGRRESLFTGDAGAILGPGAKHLGNHFPWFTILMLVAQLAMYIASLIKEDGAEEMSVNPMVGASFGTLQDLGARWFPDVRDGHIYLLFTAIFLPIGVIRFLFDVFFHWLVCVPLERMHGARTTAIIYFTAGIGGHMAGCLFTPRWLVTGSSPAMLGAGGAVLAIIALNWRGNVSLKAEALWLALFMGTSLVLGAFPGNDNWTQVGGLISGFLVSLAVIGHDHSLHISQAQRVAMRRIGVLSCVAFLVVELVLIYTVVDVDDACEWCMKASCFPAHEWCDDTLRLGAPSNWTLGA